MRKILLILTGGTICSFAAEMGKNDVDSEKAAPILEEMLRKSDSPYRNTEFDVSMPLNTLSENMTLGKWTSLIRYLQKVQYDLYEGVIILHGTDTLAYTAALLELLLAGKGVPVMMVSAQYTLQDSRSNGYANFETAVSLVAEGIEPGVYVPYRNSDMQMYLHRGRSLLQCSNYSMDFFSKEMFVPKNCKGTADRDEQEKRLSNKECAVVKKEYTLLEKVGAFEKKVLYVQPYVGIDYEMYDPSRAGAVLHGLYHAGTACVDADSYSAIDFIKKCHALNVPVFISPSEEDYAYSSTTRLLEAGAIPINGMTNEMTYVKLLVGLALIQNEELVTSDLESFMNEDICEEHIY